MFRPKFTHTVDTHRLGFTNSTQWTAYGLQRHTLIYSENHKRQTKVDNGGPFMVEHVVKQVEPTGGSTAFTTFGNEIHRSRQVAFSPQPGTLPQFPAVSSYTTEQTALRGLGATGWKRARPGNPVVSTGVWLAELRRLPTLPLRLLARLRSFRALGSEYLNVKFGWQPFIGDLVKMYELYQTLDQRLAQLVRDNGKGVRRRRKVSDTTDTTSSTVLHPTSLSAFWPGTLSPGGMSFNSMLTTQTITRERAWFVGRFRYYVPDIGSSQWTSRATRALFGLNPTPGEIWEALPWSWLVDYFTNIGDIMSNLSTNAVDNLVADYAYVMRTKSVQTIYTATGLVIGSPTGSIYKYTGDRFLAATTSTLTLTKSRARATPYGFGVSFDSLTGSQMAILGALGMSRQRFL